MSAVSFAGVAIQQSPYIPQGCFVWKRGDEVLEWHHADRARFWRQFGFFLTAPRGCTALQINHVEYEMLVQDLAEMRANGELVDIERKDPHP